MEPILLEKFLIAIGIGALIGVEREREKQKHTNLGSGFRTFILISLLGGVCAFLLERLNSNIIFVVMFSSFAALVIATYWAFAKQGLYGVITEISSLLTFTFGFIALTEYTIVAIFLVVIVVILVESEKVVHNFIQNTSTAEWADTLKFAAIALIIYPILPNRTIDPWGLINPSFIWLLVVLISGIEFVGYFLIKTLGSGIGVILNGFLGGLVSSTAVTLSMTNQSKKYPNLISSLVLATTVASITMFIRLILIIGIMAPALFGDFILFSFPALITMIILGFIMSRKALVIDKTNDQELKMNIGSPFSFKPALKMALMFSLINMLVKVADTYFGDSGIYIISTLSGLVDVDAITLSISTMFNNSNIIKDIAIQTILIAAIMNMITKALIAKFNGQNEYGNQIFFIFSGSCITGLITLIYLIYMNGIY